MKTVPERLQALREAMRHHGLSHYWIPSSDEHLNEYVPAWRQRRAWMSGFTGSAGDLLVGLEPEETWLFADGRYHRQAEKELAGSGIGLQRLGTPRGKAPRQVLAQVAADYGADCILGADPMVVPCSQAEEFRLLLSARGARMEFVAANLVDGIWTGRPKPPRSKLLRHGDTAVARSVADKREQLGAELAKAAADATAVVKLDQIAWFTNLRSSDDIAYNPVFEAYLYADSETVHLFLHRPDLRMPDREEMDSPFRLHAYGEFRDFLANRAAGRVLVDPERTTAGILDALEANPRATVVRGSSPLEEAKARKDPAERAAMERANLLASAAKVRAFLWLRRQLSAGRRVTERGFADRLEAFYREMPGYVQLSFPTIAAAGAHGAVVHYSEVDETELRPGELLLVDSGIHAAGGTTDDTRTVGVGAATEEQRRIYTLVLKAHIAAAGLSFPDKTPGASLDAVARAPLWKEKRNYGHGTGHGVGAFLTVHEGPFALSEARRPGPPSYGLRADMVTSIEPGYYAAEFGGVRLESLYRIVEAGTDEEDQVWLRFEPITWIPFEPGLLARELLSAEETDWLRRYHRQCLERLASLLPADETEQLRRELGPEWS